MAIDDKYLKTLKEEIEILLQKKVFDVKDAQKLSGLSRLLLTELINPRIQSRLYLCSIKEALLFI